MIPFRAALMIAAAAAAVVSPPVTEAATFSPNAKHIDLSLTSEDRAVLHSGSNDEYQNAMSLDYKTSGKWFVEARLDNFGITASGYNVGVCNYKAPLSKDYIGSTNNAVVFAVSGSILTAGVGGQSLGAPSAGDYIGIALDADTGQVRFRRNGGAWSNPVTLAGGGPYQFCASTFYRQAKATFNAGQDAFAYPPLSGYSPWSPTDRIDTARYWRWHVKSVSNGFVGIAEAEFRASIDGANIYGGTASASSVNPGNGAELAVDGNTATHWVSSAGPAQWWQYDFGAPVTLAEALYRVRSDTANTQPTDLALVASDDGVVFKPVSATGGLVWALGESKRFILPGHAADLAGMPEPLNLRYWFSSDGEAFSDEAGTVPVADTEGVAYWKNKGLATDHGVQPNAANRPIFREGGLNGKPYLDCLSTAPHWFNDLIEGSQPTGIISWNPYTVFVVADQVPTDISAKFIFGASNDSAYTKVSVFFDAPGGVQNFGWYKSQVFFPVPNNGGANVLVGVKTAAGAGTFKRASQVEAPVEFAQNTNARSTAVNGMRFLRHGTTPGLHFHGRIYEIIYYNKQLSDQQIITIRDALASKYAIS